MNFGVLPSRSASISRLNAAGKTAQRFQSGRRVRAEGAVSISAATALSTPYLVCFRLVVRTKSDEESSANRLLLLHADLIAGRFFAAPPGYARAADTFHALHRQYSSHTLPASVRAAITEHTLNQNGVVHVEAVVASCESATTQWRCQRPEADPRRDLARVRFVIRPLLRHPSPRSTFLVYTRVPVLIKSMHCRQWAWRLFASRLRWVCLRAQAAGVLLACAVH